MRRKRRINQQAIDELVTPLRVAAERIVIKHLSRYAPHNLFSCRQIQLCRGRTGTPRKKTLVDRKPCGQRARKRAWFPLAETVILEKLISGHGRPRDGRMDHGHRDWTDGTGVYKTITDW